MSTKSYAMETRDRLVEGSDEEWTASNNLQVRYERIRNTAQR